MHAKKQVPAVFFCAERPPADAICCGFAMPLMKSVGEIPLVEGWNAVFKLHAVMPAEFVQLRHVDELARSAVRL